VPARPADAPPRISRKLRLVSLAWLVASTAVCAGLAGELALRISRAFERRAALAYRQRNLFERQPATNAALGPLWRKPWLKYEPNTTLEQGTGDERVSLRINSLGYRTREFSPAKPPGVVRVLCVGGSTTVAGRTNDETYPAKLERLLQARYPGLPLEVLNLGISGTRSDHWLERREKLFALEPDVVVSFHGVNDLAWGHLPSFAVAHPWRRRLQSSLLFARLAPVAAPAFDALFDETLGNLLAMDRECRARSAEHLASSVPFPDDRRASPEFRRHLDADLDFWTPNFPLYSYSQYRALVERYDQRFESFTQAHGMARALVHGTLSDPGLFTDVCHLTPEGISRLAEAYLPVVADLVRDRPAFLAWRRRTAPSANERSPIRME